MNRCLEYQPLIEGMLAEEIGETDRDRLLAHAEGCTDCREFVDLHYQLQEPDFGCELPTAGQFAALRQSVLAQVRDQGARRPAAGAGVADLLRALIRRPAFAGGLAALLLIMLGAGYFAGQSAPVRLPPDTLVLDSLIAQIGQEAERNVRLSDVENSPFVFSNVAFEDVRGDRLAMRFDVTRHVEVARAYDDPLVKEILAQTLVNPTPLGTRLEAIRHAGNAMDPKIQEALIFSMLNDSTLAVRIKALNLLASCEPTEEIQGAFMMVLSGEEAVQMRLQAMEYLANSGITRESLDDVLDNLQRPPDSPLMMRAADFTRQDAPSEESKR